MHPNYEIYRKEPKVPIKTYTFRAPSRLVVPVLTIARIESDTAVDILIEGVARVCESRESNDGNRSGVDYGFTRKRSREPQSILTLHLPEDLDHRLQEVVNMEEVHVSQLVYEGMGRVILDRRAHIKELAARQRTQHIQEFHQLRELGLFAGDTE